jgi:hypothetical protein
MSGPEETKKYGVDKVAFLGLFILALLIARFITASRSAIMLSGPIKLDYGGLSASVPIGKGWRSEKKWLYRENSFMLSSFYESGPGGVTARARCRYLLAARKASVDALFEERASELGGVIAKTGQTPVGGPGSASQGGFPGLIEWVQIIKPRTLYDAFVGIAQLPNNRQLDLEVYQNTGDIDLAEGVFEQMAESLSFEDNPLFEAGGEIVSEIKNRGLESFLPSAQPTGSQGAVQSDYRRRESFFLIKDASGQDVGFTIEGLAVKAGPVSSASNAQLNIRGASFHYLRRKYDREQLTFFESDNSFDKFVWKSRTSGIEGTSSTEIVLGEDDIMNIKNSDARVLEENYRPGPAAIPDIVAELIFGPLLDSGHERIFVDIIEAEGTILPVLISKAERGDFAADEDAAHVLTVEFLDGQGFSEWLYLDEQRRISKRFLRHGGTYLIERTSAENIAKQFPQRADYILNFPFYQLQDEF